MDIRAYEQVDREPLVALALRAWAPVFASMEAVLGAELSRRLHGEDWREHQARSVSDSLTAPPNRSWVAEAAGRATGFVVATVADADRRIGEIVMVAVDPSHQRRGIGTALTGQATAWLREAGMRVVMIETGGDVGHGPARRLYEHAGFRHFPSARYFREL